MDSIKDIWGDKVEGMKPGVGGETFYYKTTVQLVTDVCRKFASKFNVLGEGYCQVRQFGSNQVNTNIYISFQGLEVGSGSVDIFHVQVYMNGHTTVEWSALNGLRFWSGDQMLNFNNLLMSTGMMFEFINDISRVTGELEKVRKTIQQKRDEANTAINQVGEEFQAWFVDKMRSGEAIDITGYDIRYRQKVYEPNKIQFNLVSGKRTGQLILVTGKHVDTFERVPISSIERMGEEIFWKMR